LLLAIIINTGIIRSLHADVVFTVFADTPYTHAESQNLPHKLTEIDERSKFIVHLGDIKSGNPPCTEKMYSDVSDIFSKSKIPVFIVPGDNEWNDCNDPDLAWQYWTKYFMHFDQRWPHELNVSRQINRPENFSFVYKKVLFIGINIVGGRVHDKAEWKQRLDDNLEWTLKSLADQEEKVQKAVIIGHASPSKKHISYFNGLVNQSGIFSKPILYLHGDGHSWYKNRPFKKAKNILRVQLDRGAATITVTVTKNDKPPFLFEPQ
jgi:hypothetical protein